MALMMRPHQWTVAPREQAQTDGKVDTGSLGTLRTVRGQITPLTSEAAYRTFGLEVKNRFLCLMDPEDGAYHPVEAEVTWNGRRFIVEADALTYEATGLNDHAGVMLAEDKTHA